MPKIPGVILLKRVLISGSLIISLMFVCGLIYTFCMCKKYVSQMISINPAKVTLNAIPCAGVKPSGTKINTAPVIIKFKITGAAAGAANFPNEFNIPD